MQKARNFLCIALSFFALPIGAQTPTRGTLGECFTSLDDLQATKLSDGLSGSRNYKITSKNDGDYVFRLLNLADSPEARRREIAAAKYAGENGVGPKIYFISDEDASILMEFVPGETLSSSRLRESGPFSAAIETLRNLHQSKGELPEGQGICKTIREQLNEAKRGEIPLPLDAVDQALKKLETLEEAFKDHPRVLCHADLHPLNMIMNHGHVQFIDWTCASLDSLFVDLGSFALLNQVQDPDQMLTLYLGRSPSAEERKWLQMGQDLSKLRLFASLFPMTETPLRDPRERQKELDQKLWDKDLLPLDHFIALQGQGNLHPDQLQNASLAALRAFLSEESL